MTRFVGVLSVLLVLLLAIGFAHSNAGHQTTLSLGILTLYRVPVTLVAFLGLFVGMLVMFATGIHSDLKVRRILRERLAEESRQESDWIDRNQQDLFSQPPGDDPGPVGGRAESGPEPENVRNTPPPLQKEGAEADPEEDELRDGPPSVAGRKPGEPP